MFTIDDETPADAAAIEHLLDVAFGSGRRAKTSYRFRQGIPPRADLARVARVAGRLVGTIRYWPVRIDGDAALLLGPLGVAPELRGMGIGRTLIAHTLALVALERPTPPVLLVGDPAYYQPLGFVPAAPRVRMPDEDPARLLVHGDPLEVPAGVVEPATAPVRLAATTD
jgi:predicted N-acetyltransferase YhbS